jgi:hypothetical protein
VPLVVSRRQTSIKDKVRPYRYYGWAQGGYGLAVRGCQIPHSFSPVAVSSAVFQHTHVEPPQTAGVTDNPRPPPLSREQMMGDLDTAVRKRALRMPSQNCNSNMRGRDPFD